MEKRVLGHHLHFHHQYLKENYIQKRLETLILEFNYLLIIHLFGLGTPLEIHLVKA